MGVTAVVAVAGAYSASQASDAAKSAAETQAAAGREAIAGQQAALTQQQKLMDPFRTAGMTALDQLVTGTAPGGQFTTPFKMEESQAQQFATKEALAAMQSQMATGGQGLSTNAIVGAGKLAGNIGSQFEQQAYNQWLTSRQQQMAPLEYLAGQGQAAAAGTAGVVGTTAANVGNLQTGIGNVQAAGTIGAAAPYQQLTSDIGGLLLAQGLKPAQTPTVSPSGQLPSVGTTPANYDWGSMAQPYQMTAPTSTYGTKV